MSTKVVGETERTVKETVLEHSCDDCGKVIPVKYKCWGGIPFPSYGIHIELKDRTGNSKPLEFCAEPCLRNHLNKEFPA